MYEKHRRPDVGGVFERALVPQFHGIFPGRCLIRVKTAGDPQIAEQKVRDRVRRAPVAYRRFEAVVHADYHVGHDAAVGASRNPQPVFIYPFADFDGVVGEFHQVLIVHGHPLAPDVSEVSSSALRTPRIAEYSADTGCAECKSLLHQNRPIGAIRASMDVEHRGILLAFHISRRFHDPAFYPYSVGVYKAYLLRLRDLVFLVDPAVEIRLRLLVSRGWIQEIDLGAPHASHGQEPDALLVFSFISHHEIEDLAVL